MDQGLITTIAMGIALSATAGFRVFVPMLAAALAGHFNIMHLPADMAWLSSWTSIICFATASIAEIAAYYIPFIDNILDTIATPLSVAAGTLLAFSILPISSQEPIVRWGLAFLAGGSTAGTIQLGTGLLRLLSSKATIGTGNVVVSTTENAAAVTSSLLTFVIPVVMALLLLVLCIWVVSRIFKKITRRRTF
ncbi:MAG TPA: DUF4126 domain-containing protein [Flavisolibacter sp.]|nr:DUF4126 domain-containing protein [Flavisolibacter sp.]